MAAAEGVAAVAAAAVAAAAEGFVPAPLKKTPWVLFWTLG